MISNEIKYLFKVSWIYLKKKQYEMFFLADNKPCCSRSLALSFTNSKADL